MNRWTFGPFIRKTRVTFSAARGDNAASTQEPSIVRTTSRPSRLAVFASALLATSALAQERGNFAGDRFRLSLSRSGLIDVEWANTAKHLSWDAGLLLNFSQNNLVLYRVSDNQRLGSLIGTRLGGNLFGALALFGWFEVGLDLPVVLVQTRDPNIAGATVTPLSGLQGGLGDLRVQPKLRLFTQEDLGVDVAVLPSLTLPTGWQSSYRGEPSVTFQPEVALSRTFLDGKLRLATNLGGVIRGQARFLDEVVGSDLTARLGLGYRFRDERGNGLPLELNASLFVFSGVTAAAFTPNQRGMEARLMAAYSVTDSVQLFLGGGVGILSGWSTPDFRLFGGLRFGAWDDSRGPKDTDKDGVIDDVDACVEVAGIADNKGCPDKDSDNDGFVDRLDACPTEKGIAELKGCPDRDADGDGLVDRKDKCPKEKGIAELEGCPDVDTDGDGVVDRLDQCKKEKEDADGFKDADGCPDPDNDDDGVTDAADRCPLEKGVVENRGCPDTDGDSDGVVDRLDNCPAEAGKPGFQGCKSKQLVVLTKDKLEILDAVFFKTGSDVIETRSFTLLDNVARVLNAHPEVKRVRVEGHTDNQGNPEKNLDLSQRRANSVKKYLVEKGKVAEGRLESKGFGDTQPIDDNKTKAGRDKNRRVVFVIGNE
jgi:outer membrane protein OmpA-like peptidoglycan-associated protein